MARDLRKDLRLYLVTDRNLARGRSELEIVRRAGAGGITAVQLRGKEMTSRELYHTGLALRQLTADLGILFIVNDRLDIALAVGADGVHLGQEDLPAAEARRLAPDMLLGATVGNAAQAVEAETAGVDYLGTDAVFPTATKTYERAPLGLEGLRLVCAATKLPVVAIGGIKAENAVQVLKAGAAGVAVVSGVVSAPDVTAATCEFRRQIEGVLPW